MANKDIKDLLGRFRIRTSVDPTLIPDYEDNDVIYIETLEVLPQIYASQLKANIICSCQQGRMELDVSSNHLVLRPGQVLVLPSGVYVDNVMVTPDFKFTVLCLTDRIIQSLLSTNVDIWNRAVYVRKENVIDSASGEQNVVARHFLALIKALIDNKEAPFRDEMIRTLLQLVLLGFCSRQKELEQSGSVATNFAAQRPTQASVLFKRFMELIREEEIKHQPVYYYAEKMCISAKYLSHICKEVTGKSANDFIQMAVVEEITYYLRSTTLSVKEISNKLGFPNISFFGKYVKSHLGSSPNDYRRHLYSEK